MKEELEQKIAEIYLKEYGSLNHFEYVKTEMNEAILEYKEDFDEDCFQHVYSFMSKCYLPIFIDKLKGGHSSFWAHKAASTAEDFKDSYLSEVYLELKTINKIWAKNELFIHCKNNYNTDPQFLSYFEILMENEEGFDLNDSFEQAEEYKNKFNEAISKGKSLIYASIFASKKAELDSSDSYCDAYAYAFENAFSLGKSSDYCKIYAEKFGDMVADKIQDLELSLTGEFYYFHLSTIIGEMQAIEFIKVNKVGNDFYSQYVFLFESKYRNLELKCSVVDPIDDEILQKTLSIINKK